MHHLLGAAPIDVQPAATMRRGVTDDRRESQMIVTDNDDSSTRRSVGNDIWNQDVRSERRARRDGNKYPYTKTRSANAFGH